MTATAPHRLTVRNAVVFDGMSAELTEASVHVVDGIIVEIGEVTATADREIDAAGAVVVPGLIDAHFHAFGVSLDMASVESTAPDYMAFAAARRLTAALSRGFTTVRDVAGGTPGLARAIAERMIDAPRYFYTGAALSQTGGHGDPRTSEQDACVGHTHMCEVVDGIDDLRRAIRDRFRRGAHAIKMMASGGVVSPTDPIRIPQFSVEEVRAITDEAARRGSYVAAHAYSPEAIVHAVDNGVRSIEHGNLLDAATADRMADTGAFLVPTLITYDAMARSGRQLGMAPAAITKNAQVLDSGRGAVELARAAGVRVGFGTDLMGSLEDEQLAGLRIQAEVTGILELLRSATSVNADLLGRPDLGRIAVGGVADLVVLEGDPFVDPTVLWAGPRTVVHDGQIIGGAPPRR